MCEDCKQMVTILIRMAKESSFQVMKKAREAEDQGKGLV